MCSDRDVSWVLRATFGCFLSIVPVLAINASAAGADAPGLRDYFRVCGITSADFAKFRDDRQMAAEEVDVVRRIALRLRDGNADSLRRLIARDRKRGDVRTADEFPSPAEAGRQRGRCVRLQGRIESIEAVGSPPTDGGETLWRCILASEASPHRIVVYVAELPSAGRAAKQPGERPSENDAVGRQVVADAVFAKYIPGTKEPLPVVVAPRWQCRATGPLEELEFAPELFDGILDNAPLSSADSGAFYRLLALTGTADAARLRREASTLDVPAAATLFRDPAPARGRLFRVAGTARRAVRVPIDDPALVAQLGTDHYFEIDLISDDLQDNPLVFCTLDLPPHMPLGGPPSYGQPIDVTGYFVKMWQYSTGLTASERASHPEAAQALQDAPLLVGPPPRWEPIATKQGSPGWVFAGLVALAAAGLGLLLLSRRQSDQEFSRYLHYLYSERAEVALPTPTRSVSEEKANGPR